MVWLVFGQTLGHDFVNFDDPDVVSENSYVTTGLTTAGLRHAFTSEALGHWDPLTTLSHMLDCQLFGVAPWGHHFTNLLLHGATTLALFLVFRAMTGAIWRSFFIAAVFAIHPLRVESVAWITERKDVLSGLFFMLTLGAYLGYVRRPPSLVRYLAIILFFALGLMAKSMLVTLPFVLLVLDVWPLRRFPTVAAGSTARRLLVEKLPLFALSAAASTIQYLVNRENLVSIAKLPFPLRIGNALTAYISYLNDTLFPIGLAVHYPHPMERLPTWLAAVAGLQFAALCVAVWVWGRKQPALLVGWLWYLGMLVPVIGLVQSGSLSHADRYTYLPQIGLLLMFTWTVADLTTGLRFRRTLLTTAAFLSITLLAVTAHAQTAHWRDSIALWTHTLACTARNDIGHNNLGIALLEKGRRDEALVQVKDALVINPRYDKARNDLGLLYLETGRVQEAIPEFLEAIDINPRYAKAHNNLGNAYLQTGQFDLAIAQYHQALKIKPDFAGAESNLGNTYFRRGQLHEAIAHYQRAVHYMPNYVKARTNLGITLLQTGRTREGLAHLEKALLYDPDYASAQNQLAWLLATHPDPSVRNGRRAIVLAEQANAATTRRHPSILRTLAAAYAEAGRFPEAIETVQIALTLAGAPDPALIPNLRTDRALYEGGTPLRETPPAP